MLIVLVLCVLALLLATEDPHGGAAEPPAGMQAQHGQLVAHPDAAGERMTWSYDGARRLRRVESPAIGWRASASSQATTVKRRLGREASSVHTNAEKVWVDRLIAARSSSC